MPPPTHIVTMPNRARRRRISCSSVAVSLAPVHPSGWPSAMAPPLTFRRSGSMASSRRHAMAWAAKASLSSIRSMCSSESPARAQRFPDGRHRTDAHNAPARLRRWQSRRIAPAAAAQRLGPLCRHHDDRGRAIARLRRIPCGDGALDVKGRLQFRQRFGRRVTSGSLVGIEREPVATVARSGDAQGTISSLNRPASIAASAR